MATTSTKDSLQAHRFMVRRVRAALLEGDAESTERPLARIGTGTYAGIFVTIALLAVAGVLGVLQPGNSRAWQEPGAFIVERETGARYVYLDGVLHPVLNHASARLLLGSALHVVTVSGRSLESATHGPPIGIPGAPDSLPDAAHIVAPDWAVCAARPASTPPAGGEPLRTAIVPGTTAVGSPPLAGEGLLLRTPDDRTFLLADGRAHLVGRPWLAAMGYGTAPTLPVNEDFVASLPAGEPIEPVAVRRLGEPGPPLPGSVDPVPIGTVYADRANGHYVMTADGLAALTPLQADLLLADPALAVAYRGSSPSALPIGQAQVTGAMLVPLPGEPSPAPAPAMAPQLAALPAGGQQLCVNHPGGEVVIGPAADPISTGIVQLRTGSGALVVVAPDAAAIPAEVPAGDPAGTAGPDVTVYLVTDSGVRYQVAGPPALAQLGLAGVGAAPLPPGLIDVLPTGQLLDPQAAASTG